MDVKKAYDKVDWEALWNVLKIHGNGGQLLAGLKAFYREASACVKMNGELSQFSPKGISLKQGYV